MRRKKHKHTRRAVKFYKIHHGFREPFKVILDGNFLHAVLLAKQGEPEEQLAKLLGAPVQLHTSRCVLAELAALGPDFRGTHRELSRKPALPCGHAGNAESATDCILSLVGERNEQHYFVATQDKRLRAALAKVPGGAVLFASVNGLHLAEPSEQQTKAVQQSEAEARSLPARELASDALRELPALQHERAREKSIFRRNRAKGPNPLAMQRKKKRKPVEGAAGGDGNGDGQGGDGQGRRKRRRKRGHGAASASEQA